MTTAAAEVTRPAGPARLLPVDQALFEPLALAQTVDTRLDVPHRADLIIDEAMAGEHPAIGRHAKISRAGAARVRTMGAAMDLAQSAMQVGKRISLAADDATFEFTPAGDHLREQYVEIGLAELALAGRRPQYRRESDTGESQFGKAV